MEMITNCVAWAALTSSLYHKVNEADELNRFDGLLPCWNGKHRFFVGR